MAIFKPAVNVVLAHEQGFADVVGDAGGPTNYGVSLRYLRTLGDTDEDGWMDGDFDRDGDVDRDDIIKMEESDAIKIYHDQWWARYHYGLIHATHQTIATKILDLSINMGPRRVDKHGKVWGAHIILQRAVNAIAGHRLTLDGWLGPKSFAAINNADPHALVVDFRLEALEYYNVLIARNPMLVKFKKGWHRRAVSI